MTPLPAPSSVTDRALEAEPLVCPGCGYDLRAAPAGGRCSECGRLVDEVELRTSGFPWARRHERGRVRTYLRTVWLVTAGSRRLAHEASRPQTIGDARAFRWVTAAVVGVALLGAFGLAVVSEGGLAFLAAQPVEPGTMSDPQWIQDVIIPWCAGATMWPVIPIALVGWTVYVTGVQRRLFRPKDASPAQLERAQAVALYAVAPLAFIFPAIVWAAVVALLVRFGTIRERRLDDLLWATWLLCGAAIFYAVLRIVQWSIRARRAGLERALVDVPRLLGLWLLGFFVCFFFLPWSVGFFWVVIDSLRG